MASSGPIAGARRRDSRQDVGNGDPPDFHAVVEVWLDGGWRLVDATRLAPVEGIVRIGIGRDATDIAFMTVFGEALMNAQSVEVRRLD